MGKQETLGFILIASVLMLWMWFTAPKQQSQPSQPAVTEQPTKDTATRQQPTPIVKQENFVERGKPERLYEDTLGKFFSGTASGKERTIVIETDYYIAELSTKGGTVKRWTLKKYKTWDQHPVQIVNSNKGDFSILFTTTDGKVINTRNHFFEAQIPIGGKKILTGDDQFTVEFVLKGSEGQIIKKLTFKNKAYDFDADIVFDKMHNVVANFEYQILWENSVRYTEHNSIDESNSAAAFTFGGGELKEVNASSIGDHPKEDPSGQTDWVAVRSKYFAVAFLSQDKKATGAYLEGEHLSAENQGSVEQYSIAIKYPFKNTTTETAKLSVFIGPLEFSTLKDYDRGLQEIMSLGWTWIRPITEYLFIPLLSFLHSIIPNYGIVIIIFSILIKFALHPLTKKSMRSMRNMQKLQPLMQEIREKYKSDPQQVNVHTMKLYKEYGVNPAGGCLPLLLQMPILFALYTLFTAAIELRQASFMLWITDLSVPDVLVPLPFSVPLLGNHISGLTLAMGITMFIQQKQTVTDPTQKMLIWMMPIMMTIMFNHFPSGLNLYYFVFNLLSIAQQQYFNKKHKDEPLKKVPEGKRKSGIMERLMKNMPNPPKR